MLEMQVESSWISCSFVATFPSPDKILHAHTGGSPQLPWRCLFINSYTYNVKPKSKRVFVTVTWQQGQVQEATVTFAQTTGQGSEDGHPDGHPETGQKLTVWGKMLNQLAFLLRIWTWIQGNCVSQVQERRQAAFIEQMSLRRQNPGGMTSKSHS